MQLYEGMPTPTKNVLLKTPILTITIMDISHIEHVGIAVPDLKAAIAFYENTLGL